MRVQWCVCALQNKTKKKNYKKQKSMAKFTGEKQPQKNPANYALGAPESYSYGTLHDRFSPQFKAVVGETAVSLRGGIRMGKCIAIEFTKGRLGERCILQIGRRKYNAALAGCVGVPPIGSFLQDSRGEWHQVMDNIGKKALLKSCLKLLPAAGKKTQVRTEGDVEALFESDDTGTLLACLCLLRLLLLLLLLLLFFFMNAFQNTLHLAFLYTCIPVRRQKGC